MHFGQGWGDGAGDGTCHSRALFQAMGGCAWGPGQKLMHRAWLEAIARGGMPRDVPGESQGSPKELSRDGTQCPKCPEEILMAFNFQSRSMD